MMKNFLFLSAIILLFNLYVPTYAQQAPKKTENLARAAEIRDMKFGMFICWSFSTFSGQEWTPTWIKMPPIFLKVTGAGQGLSTAKDTGMVAGRILM